MPGPLIISLSGTKLTDKEKTLLADKNVGGLVLFRENYNENALNPKEDLKNFIREIRAINPNIIIMVDHEGGRVWRFNKGFTKLPAAQEYGKEYDKDKKSALDKAFKDGETMARELLECGINMSLAPVVDLDGPSNIIGILHRAFHKNPSVVVEIAEQFIKGMNKAGMPATLKHFPGHGSCARDSHIAKPEDDRPLQNPEKDQPSSKETQSYLIDDLSTFKKLVENRDLSIGAVMSGFVTYPAVDPHNNAAFSPIWLKGTLRCGFGFNNVIMSDCLHMKGADIGKNLDRLKAAQSAGNDFLMYTHQHNDKQGNRLDELLAIVKEIPDTNEALQRRSKLASMFAIDRKITAESNNMLPLFGAHVTRVAEASENVNPDSKAKAEPNTISDSIAVPPEKSGTDSAKPVEKASDSTAANNNPTNDDGNTGNKYNII